MSAVRRRPIGYYVHHHGAGHGVHARALQSAIDRPVVGLGSGPPPAGWSGGWIPLPRDDTGPIHGDPTRREAWHWLPTRHPGFSDRMRAVAAWVADADPAAVISDVSCEITALAALLGVPVGHVLLHGDRSDRPHRLAFDTADLLVAPWPVVHGEPGHQRWAHKIRHLGLVSRFDGREDRSGGGDGSVLVLVPGGAHPFRPPDIEAAAVATGRRWVIAGDLAPPARGSRSVEWLGPIADPWPLLTRASLVVTAGGAGSIGDIAAARRPAVLVPQARPFDEQRTNARLLARSAPVHVLRAWPGAGWQNIADHTAALDGAAWSTLHDGHGSQRYADVVRELARDR